MPVRRGVILAAGEAPRAEAARLMEDLRGEGAVLVSCDRPAEGADYVVGDGDGLSQAQKDALGDRLSIVPEQETNDLAKAYRFLTQKIEDRPLEITIFGATGKREDHALGNIFRLTDFEREGVHVEMVTNTGRFVCVTGRRAIPVAKGAAVSVFAPEKGTKVSSAGLEWPLDGVSLDNLWSGTLNRATENVVELEADKPVIAYVERKENGIWQEKA